MLRESLHSFIYDSLHIFNYITYLLMFKEIMVIIMFHNNKCYVRQYTMFLEVFRGKVSCILLFLLGAL